jgi:NAD-dependent dihydropyrimidine dehydrogenase PreA subunit
MFSKKSLVFAIWGFSKDTIAATLDVATDASREIDPTNQLLSIFQDVTKKTGFGMVVKDVDDVDPKSVESHTTIERDEDTGEPIRSQMVYVDEHTCIGCTNCAMIAQSTFFMEESLGRAR